MDRSPDNLDDARLLPRFRERAQLIEAQRRVLHETASAATDPKLPHRQAIGEPGDLRGIPVVGARGVGGVSPHTQPEQETIRKLMREAA